MLDPSPSAGISGRPSRRFGWGALLVGTLAALVFGFHLSAETPFVDESAYLSQAYFANLWLDGDRDHIAWLEYPSYDLPPLPKYLIGGALRVAGHRAPSPSAARLWYLNTKSRFGTPEAQLVARWPSVIVGSLGCMAIFGLGVLAHGRRVGAVAALLLMVNPLYRLHARRAMSDVMAEALILLCLAVALWVWRESLAGRGGPRRWPAAGLAGIFGGLAVLAKLNGGLAMIVVATWVLLGFVLLRIPTRRKAAVAGTALVSGVVAFATFVVLNPFLTAHPQGPIPPRLAPIAEMNIWERLGKLVEHRLSVSSQQRFLFPHNALHSPLEKAETVAVQGFGRFGPFGPHLSDSVQRFDLRQDWGAVVWLPWVALGVMWAWSTGRRQRDGGEPPTAWAILAQATVAIAVVTAYLPLAWDRYFLSIQPGSALLAAGAAVAFVERIGRLVRSRRKGA